MQTNDTKRMMLLGIAGMFLLFGMYSFPRQNKTIIAEEVSSRAEHNFSDITLEARAAYVYDLATKEVLYGKNENAQLPLASITKIMTAITAVDNAPQDTVVSIDIESLKQEGDSGLYGDERWTLKDLLAYMLVVSSNDSAAAIASALGTHNSGEPAVNREEFIKKMNVRAHELGLNGMRFYNESGLDVDESTSGGYGSAHDAALLLGYAVGRYSNIISVTRYPSIQISSLDNIVHNGENTDILAARIPGLIAGKTGYSTLAGGNLAVVFDAGIQHPVAVVVLGSTYTGRFDDVDKLIAAAIKTIAEKP